MKALVGITSTVKLELADLLWRLPSSTLLTEGSREIARQIVTYGYSVVPDFIDSETVLKLADRANELYASHPQYVSRESNGSDLRIYGADRICDELALTDRMRPIDKMSSAFYGTGRVPWFQMLGRINFTEHNLGSGSGWHRDSPFSHQFKAILYLSDVGAENGPFEYIAGSHLKSHTREMCAFLRISLSSYRFSPDQIDLLEDAGRVPRRISVTGRRGTLLLIDSRGLHRGKPLVSGSRLAVTRYYFPRRIPADFLAQYPLTAWPVKL